MLIRKPIFTLLFLFFSCDQPIEEIEERSVFSFVTSVSQSENLSYYSARPHDHRLVIPFDDMTTVDSNGVDMDTDSVLFHLHRYSLTNPEIDSLIEGESLSRRTTRNSFHQHNIVFDLFRSGAVYDPSTF